MITKAFEIYHDEDEEIQAIEIMCEVLERLDLETRKRILDYCYDRFYRNPQSIK